MKQGAYCGECCVALVTPPDGFPSDQHWTPMPDFWDKALAAREQHQATTGHWALLVTGLNIRRLEDIPSEFRPSGYIEVPLRFDDGDDDPV